MIKEILNGDFMDYRIVQDECRKCGMKRAEIKMRKEMEGIKTLEVATRTGEKIWLWYDPDQIWNKYNDRKDH